MRVSTNLRRSVRSQRNSSTASSIPTCLDSFWRRQEAVKFFGAEGGSIINIGSTASQLTPPATAVYTATKGAVDAITHVLAKELGPKKVRVNSINPGMVETEGIHATGVIGSDFQNQFEAQTPLGRIAQPADIAPIAVFLASQRFRMANRRNTIGIRRPEITVLRAATCLPRRGGAQFVAPCRPRSAAGNVIAGTSTSRTAFTNSRPAALQGCATRERRSSP